MFSAVRGAGWRWMSVGKWIQKFIARILWAKESPPGSKSTGREKGTQQLTLMQVSQPGLTSSSLDKKSLPDHLHHLFIGVLRMAVMKIRMHFNKKNFRVVALGSKTIYSQGNLRFCQLLSFSYFNLILLKILSRFGDNYSTGSYIMSSGIMSWCGTCCVCLPIIAIGLGVYIL